jgi:hypothetical protein
MARIRRDLAGIVVWPFGFPGAAAEFRSAERLCTLDSVWLKDLPTIVIASAIVHEATHARLRNIRLTSENIARIEGICLGQEIAFARRVPNAQKFVSHLEARMASASPADYTEAAYFERGLVSVERDGPPRPVVAVLRMLARRHFGER